MSETATTSKQLLRGPAGRDAWREARALIDFTRMLPNLILPVRPRQTTRARKIMVLPGFGASDRATWPLRQHLARLGHHVEGWGLGVNRAGIEIKHTLADLSPGWAVAPISGRYRREGAVAMLCDRMVARLQARHHAVGGRFTLIGWSLGGVIAREAARDLPHLVEEVITLGTPVQGGPKYTAAARVFQQRGMNLDWIEREVARREATPIQARITAIVSPSDGIVGYAAAYDHVSPNVRHLEIDASHLGMCFNPSIWQLIVATLDRHQ